ncbi:MAG: O-antigen ligase family protein [Gammaproteobacteria bacterium]
MSSTFPSSMLERIFLWMGMALFFSMLFVPTTYQSIKAGVLAVLLSAIVVGWQRGSNFKLHRSIAGWTLIFVTTSAVFMVVGAVGAAPGALRVGTVYVLWPLVFTMLIGGLISEISIRKLIAVLIWAGIAIGIYGATYFGHVLGWLPNALYIEIDQGQGIGLYEGYVEYNMYSISTLLFLVPFLFAALVHWRKLGATIVARYWLWLAFLLCLGLAFASGRRALWLILLIAPVVYWILSWLSVSSVDSRAATTSRIPALLLLVIVIAAVLWYLQIKLDLDLSAMAEQLFSAFDFSGERSASLRAEQAQALFSEWQNRPLLGYGHGAAARGSLRSYEFPWAYELSYLALLFHTGLLGTLVYASCVVWVYWQGLKVARHSLAYGYLMIPILVGTTCFLIGNATNPYLEKFDFMWVIFLPLAIINRYLIESHSSEGRT